MTACSNIHLWSENPQTNKQTNKKANMNPPCKWVINNQEFCALTLKGLSGMLTPPQEIIAVCFTGLRGVYEQA